MFYGCKSLTSLNLSNFNTPEVVNMAGIFGKCLKLEIIDIRKFESTRLKRNSNLFNEVGEKGTIYYNSRIFNESLLDYKSIKKWNKINI